MIRGIRGQFDRELRCLGKGHEPVQKLAAMAVILGPVIQVENPRPDMLKAFSHALPPLLQHIDQTITGDFGGDTRQKEFIRLGNQDTYRGHSGTGFEIVVSRFDAHALLATT